MSKEIFSSTGFTSHVRIDKRNNTVEKTIKPIWIKIDPGLIEREVYFLKKMHLSTRTPDLISYNSSTRTITMTYKGVQLTKENMPSDYADQINSIIKDLKRSKCCHNDITPTQLLLQHGQINIIDGGWATIENQPIPANWGKAIGGRFKKGVHQFDDEYSLNKSIQHILQ